MFGVFKKPTVRKTASPHGDWARLNDRTVIEALATFLNDYGPVGSALVIIALDVADILYHSFTRAVRNDGHETELAPNLDGFGAHLFDGYTKAEGMQGEDREINTHRMMYLFMAAQLRRMQVKAHQGSVSWDDIAPLWVHLLGGALELPNVVKTTALWRKDELEPFAKIATPEESLSWVETVFLPKPLQHHDAIETWRARDMTPADKADIDEFLRSMN